jgi:hypothetical protein
MVSVMKYFSNIVEIFKLPATDFNLGVSSRIYYTQQEVAEPRLADDS